MFTYSSSLYIFLIINFSFFGGGVFENTYLFLLFWGIHLQRLATQEILESAQAPKVQDGDNLTQRCPSYYPPSVGPASGQTWRSWWNLQNRQMPNFNNSLPFNLFKRTMWSHKHEYKESKSCHSHFHYSTSHCETEEGLTSDWGAGRPGGDGVSSLVEQNVGSTCAHLSLWNRLGTAVIITVPLTVNGVPTKG